VSVLSVGTECVSTDFLSTECASAEFGNAWFCICQVSSVCQVTVFGSGSGATSISTLLASSASHGLFSRAWLSNPSPKPQRSLTQAELQNEAFFK